MTCHNKLKTLQNRVGECQDEMSQSDHPTNCKQNWFSKIPTKIFNLFGTFVEPMRLYKSSLSLRWVFDESSMSLPWVFNESSMSLRWVFDESSMNLQWVFDETLISFQGVFEDTLRSLQGDFEDTSMSLCWVSSDFWLAFYESWLRLQ